MNTQTAYSFIGVFLILVLLFAANSIYQNDVGIAVNLDRNISAPDSDCLSVDLQCLTININVDGTIHIDDENLTLLKINQLINEKYKNTEDVYIYVRGDKNLELQKVLDVTNDIGEINSRIKVIWSK